MEKSNASDNQENGAVVLQQKKIEAVRKGIIEIVTLEKSHINDLSGYIPAAKRNQTKIKMVSAK
jgi:hypothetical protein